MADEGPLTLGELHRFSAPCAGRRGPGSSSAEWLPEPAFFACRQTVPGPEKRTLRPMKNFCHFLPFLLAAASAFAAEPMRFVSPDRSSTLVVDKSGPRDLIELKSAKRVHRLFSEDLDAIFKPKLAKAFNASLNKVGKVVPPTFTSASWLSAEEVEIKGRSNVIINNDNGHDFTFTATVSMGGSIKNLTVAPASSSAAR